MSEPPPLPPGDDPHEILGVPPGAGERELRRAYARRIREYRPETHPQEFARIRAAFELLTAAAEFALPSAEAGAAAASPADPRRERIAAAWNRLAEGDPEDARDRLAALRAGNPDWAPATVHLFLLEDALESPLPERLAILGEGLNAGAPLLPDLFGLLEARELRRLARTDACAWPVLRRQPDAKAARGLFRHRQQEFWLMGEDDRVYADLAGPEFERDAHDSAELSWLGREAAAVAAWLRPSLADELHAKHGSDEAVAEGMVPEDHHAVARAASPAYRAWHKSADPPTLLDRFLRVAPALDPEPLRRLLAAQYEPFSRHPRDWHDAFDSLEAKAPRALEHYVALLRSILDPEGKRGTGQVGDVAPERTLRALVAVEKRMHGSPHRTRELSWLLASVILEVPVAPIWMVRALESRRLRFSPRFQREIGQAAADPALAAFYWTRLLAVPLGDSDEPVGA